MEDINKRLPCEMTNENQLQTLRDIIQVMHNLTRATMKRVVTGLCKPTQPLDLKYPENLSYGVGA
jgi:hypothetical protein